MIKNVYNPIRKALLNKVERAEMAKTSHSWFFVYYFQDHLSYPLAEFHRDMLRKSEDDSHKMMVFMGFRGCGKSLIFSLSYVIWSILGRLGTKNILILSKTRRQCEDIVSNIEHELNNNYLLRRDFGIGEVKNIGNRALYLPKHNAKITVASIGQSLRGMKYAQYRPQVIILDDVEDSSSSNDRVSEDIYNWLTKEVILLGDQNTRYIVLGNLLGIRSLLMRLREDIRRKKVNGLFQAYPILDDNGKIMWPGKFPNMKVIENYKSIISDKVWETEFLMRLCDSRQKFVTITISLKQFLALKNSKIDEIKWDKKLFSAVKIGPYTVSAPILYGNGFRAIEYPPREPFDPKIKEALGTS